MKKSEYKEALKIILKHCDGSYIWMLCAKDINSDLLKRTMDEIIKEIQK